MRGGGRVQRSSAPKPWMRRGWCNNPLIVHDLRHRDGGPDVPAGTVCSCGGVFFLKVFFSREGLSVAGTSESSRGLYQPRRSTIRSDLASTCPPVRGGAGAPSPPSEGELERPAPRPRRSWSAQPPVRGGAGASNPPSEEELERPAERSFKSAPPPVRGGAGERWKQSGGQRTKS